MAKISYPDPNQIPEPLAGMLAAIPGVAATDMLAHSPVLAEHFLRLAHAQFTALELSERARELVILSVAAKVRCEFEYQQHIPISAAAGVEPALRQAIWDRAVDPTSVPDAENVLIGFVTDVLNRPRGSARRFSAVQRLMRVPTPAQGYPRQPAPPQSSTHQRCCTTTGSAGKPLTRGCQTV